MKTPEAFKILGIAPTNDVAEIDQAWRVLRSKLHPDKPSGDKDKFDQARKAYDLVWSEATKPKPCLNCDGLGKLKQQRGFTIMERKCPECKGSGKQ